jgi:hypothetical protein
MSGGLRAKEYLPGSFAGQGRCKIQNSSEAQREIKTVEMNCGIQNIKTL